MNHFAMVGGYEETAISLFIFSFKDIYYSDI